MKNFLVGLIFISNIAFAEFHVQEFRPNNSENILIEVFSPDYQNNGRFNIELDQSISDEDLSTLRRILKDHALKLETLTSDKFNRTHEILANP